MASFGIKAERNYQSAQFVIAAVTPRLTNTGKQVYDVKTTEGQDLSCWDEGVKNYIGVLAEFQIYGQSYRGQMQYTIDLKRTPIVKSAGTTPAPSAPQYVPTAAGSFVSPSVITGLKASTTPPADTKQRAMFMAYAKDLTVACINNGWLTKDAPIMQVVFDFYEDITRAVEEGVLIAKADVTKYIDEPTPELPKDKDLPF